MGGSHNLRNDSITFVVTPASIQKIFLGGVMALWLRSFIITFVSLCSLGVVAQSIQPPISTAGRHFIDSRGEVIRLASINWYGASDAWHVVGGLDHRHRSEIAKLIVAMGFNSVRLPFSNAMIYADSIDKKHLRANPDLIGKSPLAIFDATIKALTDVGLLVILNNHTTTPKWCCGVDENALWFFENYTTEEWMSDWEFLVRRYKSNPFVIGADLRNEVRKGPYGEARWGSGDQFDWAQVAESLGNKLLDINPDILIVVEGTNYAQNLRGPLSRAIQLSHPNRLVYSPHTYGWFWGRRKAYKDMSYDELATELDYYFGYLASPEGDRAYPIWVSELGVGIDDKSGWFHHLMRYLNERQFSWAFWPLNRGPKSTGEPEEWGLVDESWSKPRDGDWRLGLLRASR
jgi:endoglucanase